MGKLFLKLIFDKVFICRIFLKTQNSKNENRA